jgi:hypothetical protein
MNINPMNPAKQLAIGSGVIFLLTCLAWYFSLARAAEGGGDAVPKAAPKAMTMDHIMTQAQAEALKPGDSMSMACSSCKKVTVYMVGDDKSYIQMMTIGEKTVCDSCGGTVTVVGTGKGAGKNEEVKHVCSKCGDDAMFCTATKPGSGAMNGMKMK